MSRSRKRWAFSLVVATSGVVSMSAEPAVAGDPEWSIARTWNEQLLSAIRKDLSRPTVHARNLCHVSAAVWDAWAAYDAVADQWLHHEKRTAMDVEAARAEAISFAAYRVLKARFASAPGAAIINADLDAQMDALGYDRNFKGTIGNTPRALGNRIAITVLSFGLNDGANESGGFGNQYYVPVNPPLVPYLPGYDPLFPLGNPTIVDPNRWQPLALNFFVDQQGNVYLGGYPPAVTPEWGIVTPFGMGKDHLEIFPHEAPNFDWYVYHDVFSPPLAGTKTDAFYRWNFEFNVIWSSHLNAEDGVMWDISPASLGNAQLPELDQFEEFYDVYGGGDWGTGYAVNPVTGEPYEPQIVKRGDYCRTLVEFWSDGPSSETPPGHWFVIVNEAVTDHPLLEKRYEGEGPVLGDLEWDVKMYLTLGGTVHDTAVAVWGQKGYYDFVRPISAIRWMIDHGQCSDPKLPSFSPDGVHLHDGHIELISAETTAPGERHEHLAGYENEVAIYAWLGPTAIEDPKTEVAGVGWIRGKNFFPYFPITFVSPPFPGYPSGHSAFSRACSETLTDFTGSEYFPGGMGEFHFEPGYLDVEFGPSEPITLQWAKYADASDQTSLSRIWGGIHPPVDDLPSRHIGKAVSEDSFQYAKLLIKGRVSCPNDLNGDRTISVADLVAVILGWGGSDLDADSNLDGVVNIVDIQEVINGWGACPPHP